MKKAVVSLFLSMLILLGGCSTLETVSTPPSTPEVETTPDISPSPQVVESTPEFVPIDITDLYGSWDGVLSEPLGFPIILDFLTVNDSQNIYMSFTTDERSFLSYLLDYEIEGNTLKLWRGSEPNRISMDLNITSEGVLIGSFTNNDGETASATFTQSADSIVDVSDQGTSQKDFVDLLNVYPDFSRDDAVPVSFEYIMSDPKLDELRDTYGLDEIAGNGNTQSKALNLLHWLCEHTSHDGYNNFQDDYNALSFLEYAYDTGKGINCANLSVTLSEACLSVGIQARALWLMPENPIDMDNHVVVMAFIPEDDRWIMLDPSFNCYLSDMDNIILSPWEIRQKLAAGEIMKINTQSEIGNSNYTDYLSKDMFYFYSARTTKYGAFDERVDPIYLCPTGFDVMERNIANSFYRNSWGTKQLTNDEVSRRKTYLSGSKNIFATPESFFAG